MSFALKRCREFAATDNKPTSAESHDDDDDDARYSREIRYKRSRKSDRIISSVEIPLQVGQPSDQQLPQPLHQDASILSEYHLAAVAGSALLVLRSLVCWIRQQPNKSSVVKPTWLPSFNRKASQHRHEQLKDRAAGKRVVRRRWKKSLVNFCGLLVGKRN